MKIRKESEAEQEAAKSLETSPANFLATNKFAASR